MSQKIKYEKLGFILIIFPLLLFGSDPKVIYPSVGPGPVYNRADPLTKIGEYAYPTNPLNDRAKGYLLAGKIKNAVTNFGNIIEGNYHPSGLWGDYASIWNVSFLAGVSTAIKTI